MSKSYVVSLFVIFCFVDLGVSALDCLKCYSDDPQSECRLGTRKNKPKIDSCDEKEAKCYAIGIVYRNGTGLFERGCSIVPDLCESNSEAEFCNTCRFNYCNFAFMQLASDVDDVIEDFQEVHQVDSLKNELFLEDQEILEDEREQVPDKSVEKNSVVQIRRKLFRTLKDREESVV